MKASRLAAPLILCDARSRSHDGHIDAPRSTGAAAPQREKNVSQMARPRTLQQQPAHAERLLHALVVRGNLVPEGPQQIRSFDSMPRALRIIAGLAGHHKRTHLVVLDARRSHMALYR